MAYTDQVPAPKPGQGMALASLLTGVGAVLGCGIGVIAGPVAVVLGIVAGKKGGYGGKALGGIILGAFGFLVSVGAIIGLVVYAGNGERRSDEQPIVTQVADADEPAPDAVGELVLTEAGVGAAGYATAYEAYLDVNGVSEAFGGVFAGDAIDTPCFSLDGEAWWVVEGDPDVCEPASELWWETYSDSDEIKLFGGGGAGAAISFEGLTLGGLEAKVGASDLASLAAYAKDELLVPSGATEIVETQTTLDGAPAVRFDCTFEGLSSYRLYVVLTPDSYAVGDNDLVGFIIHAYNEAEWVYTGDDVYARLENTLQWK